MKELILIRHAKSDWGAEFLKDVDRPLNERGYTDAYYMSKWYHKNKNIPQRIIASTATRALNTGLIFAREFEMNADAIVIEPRIYECNVHTILSVIKEQPDSVNSLMIFCHNPCITDTCNKLTDEVFFDNVPTCGIVNLTFDIKHWKEIEDKKAGLGFFQFPKDFRNTDT